MLRASFVCALGVGALIVSAAACGRTVRQLAGDPGDGGAEGSGIPSFVDDDAAIHQCSGADPASSLGCEYLAVEMDGTFDADNGCFVVTLANASPQYPAHVDVSFDGSPIDLSQFAKLPTGNGKSMTYAAYDPNSGIQPGQVVILFLAGPAMPGTATAYSDAPVPCPVAPALSALTQIHGTGMGQSFRIRTDQPVVV